MSTRRAYGEAPRMLNLLPSGRLLLWPWSPQLKPEEGRLSTTALAFILWHPELDSPVSLSYFAWLHFFNGRGCFVTVQSVGSYICIKSPVPSSFLLLVVRPGAPSNDALVPLFYRKLIWSMTSLEHG